LAVDKEIKQFKINTIFSCKLSWDFSGKEECDLIIFKWQITFQVLEHKEKYFLDLNDDDNLPAKPMYTKDNT